MANPDGQWRLKDEDDFNRRLEVGIDSAEHQARVKKAAEDFIGRFENNDWPFNCGWDNWQPPEKWRPRKVPDNWPFDFGTHELL